MTPLADIAATFHLVDGMERLELLLDYADALPPLPDDLAALRDAGIGRVHECQSPVFLAVRAGDGGRLRVFADVPEEAPTARGFAGLLVDAFDGADAATLAAAPADLLGTLGISGMLGMQRTRGLGAVYARLRADAAAVGDAPESAA